MATRKTQPGGNSYNEGFAIPSTPRSKSDADRIELLENKVGILTKLLFERNTKSPKGPNDLATLYFRKTLIFPKTLQIELVSDGYFASKVWVDIRFSISSKTNDEIYFSKRFRVQCDKKGSFPRILIMTTLDLEKKARYADMILSAVTVDIANAGRIGYVEDMIV